MAANLSYNPESLVSLFFKLFLQKVFLINYYIDFFLETCFHPFSLSPITCYLCLANEASGVIASLSASFWRL